MNYTADQRAALQDCEICMSELCEVCGHEPCPECLDFCDDQNCLVAGAPPLQEALFQSHDCIFRRCEKHRTLATGGGK